jgi:hypothetical protein
MRRRDVVIGLSTAAAWPIAAASQPIATPVIGFLYSGESSFAADRYAPAVREGPKEEGYSKARTSRSIIPPPRADTSACRLWSPS